MFEARRIATAALLLLPGGLVLFFSANSGGFYPDAYSLGALVLLFALVLRVTLAADPFEGVSRWGALVAGALGLFALWQLASWQWSDEPGRAVLEFDRTLLYVAALVLFGTVPRTEQSLRWIVRGIAMAIIVVGTVALITRILPEVWPTEPNISNSRLSYPVSYWNSLGLLMAMGIPLLLHVSSDPREPVVLRVLGAAAIPVLATTLYFTFSRGAIAAGAVGLAVYLLVGRPRLLLSTLLAAGATTAFALLVAYDADVLSTNTPHRPAGVAEGQDVAVAVAACVAAAAGLRLLFSLVLDDRLLLLRGPGALRRRGGQVAVVAALVVALVAAGLAVDVPGRLDRGYDRFVTGGGTGTSGSGADQRKRLTDPANNGRIDFWRVAQHRFEADPLKGDGAGTWVDAWLRDRPVLSHSTEAHSLYMDALSEFGAVGLGLLVIAVLGVLIRLATLARGPTRSLYAALFAAALMWALETGVDWQWETPAVSIVFFAAGGAALAAAAPGRSRPASPGARLFVGAACLLACVTPALVWYSQSRLTEAQDAYNAKNCPEASRKASQAFSALGMRPDPLEIIAYCDLRSGDPQLALETAERAVELQPGDWRVYYNRAVMKAAAGRDPRSDAQTALRMNPFEVIAQDGARRLSGDEPRSWRAAAQLLGSELIR